ncbi:40S ribosomal protein S12-like [Lotus japonicus]|uniref:40S ribosomal protein S12-like n=1 Tax=Lotus japonicus TaxID=34305 RepID=UPI002588C57D|nr:40S ribosomal protein S12-like [Lotus japonicus]
MVTLKRTKLKGLEFCSSQRINKGGQEAYWTYGGLSRGLHEGAKVIEKHAGQLCVLAEDCDQPDYVKLVKALCAEHNVSLITVPSAKTLGEWAGLCKIDSEGKARKVTGCSCVVVKDFGEEHEAYNVVLQHV